MYNFIDGIDYYQNIVHVSCKGEGNNIDTKEKLTNNLNNIVFTTYKNK